MGCKQQPGNCLDAGLLHVNGTYRFAARDALTLEIESAFIVTYRNV